VRVGACSFSSSSYNCLMDSLRPDEALRWKVETMVGKVGKWYVKRWHLQGCIPRLCRLRTDELALASKY
jgi:hypothetical protein